MNIRAATVDDIPHLFRVRTAVTENAMDREALARAGITTESTIDLLQMSGKAWVGICDEQIVAFSIANAETQSVWALFVLPEYEGRGFGRALIEVAVDWLWSKGASKIWLSTDQNPTTRVNGFYQHPGWKPEMILENGELRYVLHRSQEAPQ